jgi:hypothetical protein
MKNGRYLGPYPVIGNFTVETTDSQKIVVEVFIIKKEEGVFNTKTLIGYSINGVQIYKDSRNTASTHREKIEEVFKGTYKKSKGDNSWNYGYKVIGKLGDKNRVLNENVTPLEHAKAFFFYQLYKKNDSFTEYNFVLPKIKKTTKVVVKNTSNKNVEYCEYIYKKLSKLYYSEKLEEQHFKKIEEIIS